MMNKSGVVHDVTIQNRETAIGFMEAIKENSGLFVDEKKRFEARCRKGKPYSVCDWQEVKQATIRDTQSDTVRQSFNATCGDLPTNKKRLRNYISRCVACGATRYDSELI